MKQFFACTLLLAMLFVQPVFASAQTTQVVALPPCAGMNTPEKAILLETRSFPLKTLSGREVLSIRGTDSSTVINFGSRADALITRAVLHLRYTYSPALLPGQSHLKVMINDEIIGVLPLGKENGGRNLVQDIEIDPRLITDFNHLKLQFIGHYATECEEPQHSSLWIDISGLSALELTSRPIPLISDLATLPEPFFDRRDLSRLTLPFVFAATPSRATLNAAGITSSWFGKLASWRGSRFPAHLDQLPRGHAVVFATNTERPAFLKNHPKAIGPTISIITNQADCYSKLLLVLGRDGDDLLAAARALVLSNAVLSGQSALISDSKHAVACKPYDAPNWVRLDRPMKFGELVNSPQDLQAFGHTPDPLRINLKVPPDLFTWHSRGVPVDIKYRYTPPISSGESRLSVSINDELVQSFNLRTSGQGGEISRLRLPLLGNALLNESREIFLPAFKLGASNQLQFSFSFIRHKVGPCSDTTVENVRAMVDADSKVDFTGFPLYAEMPNLNYFATSGFPFSKYADLSQTVVVLTDRPTAKEIETMLTLLGRMGEASGYPATKFKLAGPVDKAMFKDADLLIIGTAMHQSVLGPWNDKAVTSIAGLVRRISQPTRISSFLYEWFGFGTEPDPAIFSQDQIESQGALAALLGFESPVSNGRSVVAVTAATPAQLGLVLDVLDNPGLVKSMHGSVVIIHPQKVASFLVGGTYSVGSLPFWTAIWYPLSERPVLLAVLAVLSIVLFALAIWRTLKAIAKNRLREDE